MLHPNCFRCCYANQIIVALLLTFFLLPPANAVAQTKARNLRLARGTKEAPPNGGLLDGRGKLWAVVIGVSKYRNLSAQQQLSFAHRDAEEFAAFLRTPAGGGFPAHQVKVMLDQEATLMSVRTQLGTILPRDAEANDVVLIFFAGHGLVEGERNGYLLLHDSDPQNLYATALQLSELDHIISKQVRARNVILITDACHAGQLGPGSRDPKESVLLINQYLTEIGKSGKGVIRLLASRADELSYEDKRWGGGHGVFTYHLLEGLKGAADRDRDGFVRADELEEFLSTVVPKATQALQHPQAAGTRESRLPLAITKLARAEAPTPVKSKATEAVVSKPKPVKLEVSGVAGSEVYVDNTLRGLIGRNGKLMIEKLSPGKHEVAVRVPGGGQSRQEVLLEKDRTTLEVSKTVAPKPLSVAEQISQALVQGQTENALKLYEQLLRTEPKDPHRPKIEAALSLTMESIGKKVVADYLQAPLSKINRPSFRQGAEAYKWLKLINAGQSDPQQEVNYLFCEGRAMLEEARPKEALGYLEKATAVAPQAAHVWNAVGLANDKLGLVDPASEAYKQAAKLAPSWAEPQYHLGALYLRIGRPKQAEQPLTQAAKSDPTSPEPRALLARMWRMNRQWQKAEAEAMAVVRTPENNPSPSLATLYGETWYELAQVYEATKRYAQAAEAYEKVLALMPHRTDREPLAEKARKLRSQLAASSQK
jgi:tetratricopeptide (TPR) repeat protein